MRAKKLKKIWGKKDKRKLKRVQASLNKKKSSNNQNKKENIL